MARRIGLGKGLDALLDNNEDQQYTVIESQNTLSDDIENEPEETTINKERDIVQLQTDKLIPNPGQPRKNFNETELQELAFSR